MKARTIHYNPPEPQELGSVVRFSGRTRCGRRLAKVEHREDPKDATCDTCVKLAMKDGAL